MEQLYDSNDHYLIDCDREGVPEDLLINAKLEGDNARFVGGKKLLDEILPKVENAQVIKLERKALPLTGPGRLIILDNPLSLEQAIEKVKKHLGLKHLRLAIGSGQSLSK